MNRLLRVLAMLALAIALWPEFARYAAEWDLAQANARLNALLRKQVAADLVHAKAEEARALAEHADRVLPEDPRAALLHGIALMLANRGADARDVLDAAVRRGERPELLVNLARARATQNNIEGANAAFLRAAWASSYALATVPKSVSETLQKKVEALEVDLHEGHLSAPPPF